jgi:hypothetical protein
MAMTCLASGKPWRALFSGKSLIRDDRVVVEAEPVGRAERGELADDRGGLGVLLQTEIRVAQDRAGKGCSVLIWPSHVLP